MRDVANFGIMEAETARCLIQRAFEAVEPGGSVSFLFQGGEPTVAGLGFFKEFVRQVTAARPLNVRVLYALQTNGMVIDEQWADFFLQNDFLVGVSVDGYRDLHDANRLDGAKKGTYGRVTRAVQLLLKKGVAVNLLCVVTGQCARHPQKVYEAMKKLGTGFLQFILCLDPLEGERGSFAYSVSPKEYGSFLCTVFDLWFRDWQQGQYTSVRLFDDYVHLAMGLPAGNCATSGGCGSYFVVEGDGSIYPCDFYVIDRYRMGNIRDMDFEALMKTSQSQTFLKEGLQRPAQCASCRWLRLCNGGCRRDWVFGPEGTQNYYCEAFQQLFEHGADRIAYVAQCERQARQRYR